MQAFRVPRFMSLAFMLSFAALCAGNSGATTFALSQISPVFEGMSPIPYYILALGVCALCIKPVPMHSLTLFLGLALVLSYFLLATLWSPSFEYRIDKAARTIVVPTTMVLAGYFVARKGGINWFAAAAGVYALIIAVAVVATGQGITASLEALLVSDEARSLDYQRFSIICGAAAAVLIPLLRLDRPVWLGVAAVLAVLALGSGGRTGALLIGVGILVRMSMQFSPRVIIPVAVVAIALGFFALNPIIEFITGIAADVGAPETILRALQAAIAPPEITRVWNRPEFLRAAFEIFRENPLIGAGWGGFPTAAGLPDELGFHPHNIVAELLAETGLIGLVLFALWFSLAIGRLIRLRAEPADRPFVASVWAALLCGLTVAMFIGDLPSQWLLFVSLGLGIGCFDTIWLESRARRNVAPRRSVIELAGTS
ncbi:MAG: O-antigen ligase family protein [Brevundimonas sp.]|nr:O-antigen ligase family protein [Brevundimonas sp.]